jgi:uncharacterized membrane protein
MTEESLANKNGGEDQGALDTSEKLLQGDPTLQQIAKFSMTSGPLPPPDMLEEYERILPGAAKRIFERADEEADHRREMDRRALETAWEDQQAERRERRLGQILGFMICLALIAAGVLIAGFTRSTAGTIVGGLVGVGGLASVIVAFISGRD